MNISTQLCGLMILSVLLVSFFNQKRVGLHSERVFLHVMCITYLSVFLDMCSLIAIHYQEDLPELFVELVCKSYIATVVMASYAAFVYVLNDVYDSKKFHKNFMIGTTAVALEALVIFALPIFIYSNGKVVYTYGPAVLITYIFAIIFIIATFICIGTHRDVANRQRMHMVMIWMGIWFTAAAIQFFNNQILIVGFASAIGMLILYCSLENPENNMDRRLGCFHTHALMEYLKECFERKESKSILLISLSCFQMKNASSDYVNECIIELIHFCEKYKNAKVFKNIDQELLILFSDVNEMNLAFQEIQDHFYADYFYAGENKSRKVNRFPKTLFALVTDSMIVSSPEELLQVFRYVKLENQQKNKTMVCYVNEKVLSELRQNEDTRQEIVDALEEDRVEIFLQPIYSTKKNCFTSAEVLARIRNRDGSVLSPGVFIPIAEESGLIVRIGERIFEKTCAFLNTHQLESLGLEYVEVNLSVVQCEQRNLADRYIKLMEKHSVKPWWINLEITETGSVQIKNTLLENMNQLIRYGVTFSLDDFGNGQSNLDYMIDMPVSIMKFDMNMTRAYFENYKAKYVVQSTIKLAHEMEMLVVAEGVETKEQLDEMKSVGVDYIQGYFFSKPLSVHEFLTFVKKYQEPGSFIDKI